MQTKEKLERPPMQLKHDGSVTIAIGPDRKATVWNNQNMKWSELVTRLSQTIRTSETCDEYHAMDKDAQGEKKDVGGFVGGPLKGKRRRNENVAWKHLLTYDFDDIEPENNPWDLYQMIGGYAAVMYSTHSHTPDKLQLRMIMPLSEPVEAARYGELYENVAKGLGLGEFDRTGIRIAQFMYWPSTPKDGEYLFDYVDDQFLNPHDFLSKMTPEKEEKVLREVKKQEDPLTKEGLVGDFCRIYSIQEAIETFLPQVYHRVNDDLYDFVEGSGTPGFKIYEDKFGYSFHSTDPCSSKLVNAFDLVRIHLYGHLDAEAKPHTTGTRLPSYMSMMKLASEDPQVKRQQIEDEFGEVERFQDQSLDWMDQLERNKKKTLSNVHNVKLILNHDPALSGKFARDTFAYRELIINSVPWRTIKKPQQLEDADDSGLRNFFSEQYGITGKQIIDDSFKEVLLANEFHPVRDYLKGLEWDGVPRVETLLVDYLGAEDNELTRAMTRLTLTGAVARVFNPGCKFDYVLTLIGPQGIGKSSLLKLLGEDWFTDSIDDVRGKEAYERIQGSWIIELGELAALRKAEVEAVKKFVTTQVDKFRQAYGRRSGEFPRQCIFIASTNDEHPLKDSTGNRRFWPVRVGNRPTDWEKRKNFPRDQIWAESVQLFKKGEPLKLPDHLEKKANEAQKEYTEESPLADYIREGLERPWELDIYDDSPRDRVCALEIWVDMLRFSKKDFTSGKAREITAIMKNTPGWMVHPKNNGRMIHDKWGKQTVFERIKDR